MDVEGFGSCGASGLFAVCGLWFGVVQGLVSFQIHGCGSFLGLG